MQTPRFLLALAVSLAPSLTWAISEQDYQASFDLNVMPHYLQKQEAGSFKGVDDLTVRYVKFPSPVSKAALVILPGRTEGGLKYAEVVYDLRDAGFTLYLLDHRGQGFSDRTIDHPQKHHVKRFQDYVDDLRTFVDVVRADGHEKVFILAHSMGGAIATLLEEQHPGSVNAMVLLAPMHEMVTGQYPEDVALLLAAGYITAGQAEEYALGNGDRKPSEFKDNKGTHSEARWTQNQKLLDDNPDLVRGGVTFNWAHEAILATKDMRNNADRLKTPFLLVTAGDDQTVKPGGQRTVCEAARSCERFTMDGALHEMLLEKDEIRDHVLNETLRFLTERLDGIPPKERDASLGSCQASGAPTAWLLALALLGLRRRR